ncbi:MAG: alpha/beta fold hydrolase [Pseudomonadota bacterium]|nr:alpha/beta fold hydrolase [Pseudomonadota bacterium]MBU1570890.1 alpha/beta fold hydrolase [Pseudomonadota bacterium]
MEEKILFKSGDLELEGILEKNYGDRGVIITHPHPLYGGDMYNPVVGAIANAYRDKGYSTLRFNFRGVGESGGKHDNGIGEQDDLLSAISYMNETGINQIDISGYSFGTFVNAGAVRKGARVRNMTMVSPPVAFMEFGRPVPISCLKLVITGSYDEVAPVEFIRKTLFQWNPEAGLEVIEGTDHFYAGYLKKLEEVLSLYILRKA